MFRRHQLSGKRLFLHSGHMDDPMLQQKPCFHFWDLSQGPRFAEYPVTQDVSMFSLHPLIYTSHHRLISQVAVNLHHCLHKLHLDWMAPPPHHQ